jgi:hypothetical protein
MTTTITPDELRALAATTRGAKYGNTRGVWVDELGRRFDSQREVEAAVALWRRQRAGEIRGLAFQVRWPILVDDVLVCTYVADFQYEERQPDGLQWRLRLADAKGFPTPLWKIKKRLMKAVYSIDILEL